MQEMSRGALPAALIIDDEVEAWTIKNLYIASRLKNDPRAPVDPNELADFSRMTADYGRWRGDLQARYQSAALDAMDLKTIGQIQDLRAAQTRARPAATAAEQSSKSLDLLMQTRAARALDAAASSESARLDELRGLSAQAAADAPRLLGAHYLAIADDAPNAVEARADLQLAEEYAQAAGDAALLARVRARENRKP
jgi:hypothetical protein